MTRTIVYAALVSGIAALMILYGTASAIPAGDLDFVWDPADASSDPTNLIVITGSFVRVGLLSDLTTDVQGEISIGLTGTESNISETILETVVGDTTITTTVNAHSHETVKKSPDGVINIDGEDFRLKFKTSGTTVPVADIDEEFVRPTGTTTLSQQKITIPGSIVMCNDDKTTCFEGFGVIRRESSVTEFGGSTLGFFTDNLEAELIGDSGFFNLNLNRLQRTVT